MPDPNVVQMAIQAARKTGADPVVFLASGLVESGLRHDAVGDGGTSFGAYQWHRGGALGNHPPEWTRTMDAYLERANAFAKIRARNGAGAAAAQRPADRAGYARKVDAAMGQARRLMQGLGLSGIVQGNEAGVGGASGVGSPTRNPSLAPSNLGAAPSFPQASPVQGLLDSNAEMAGLPKLRMPKTLDINIQPDTTPDPSTGQPVQQPLPDQGTLGNAIVNAAMNLRGIPYSWGGGTDKGPSKGFGRGANTVGFDCSSLVKHVFAKFGISIPRVTYDQFKAGSPVPREQMQAGDLLFFRPGSRGPGHVALYIGNGQFLHAPQTGDVVKVSSLASRSDLVGVRRYR